METATAPQIFPAHLYKYRVVMFSVSTNFSEEGLHGMGLLEDGRVHCDMLGYGLSDWSYHEQSQSD